MERISKRCWPGRPEALSSGLENKNGTRFGFRQVVDGRPDAEGSTFASNYWFSIDAGSYREVGLDEFVVNLDGKDVKACRSKPGHRE